jgi:hypothetical protein
VPGIASANNAKRRPAEFAQERLIELRDNSTRVGVAGQRLDTRNNLAEKALTDVADALLYPARIASRSASADSVNRMVIFAGMWLFQTEACLRVCERYLPASIKVRGPGNDRLALRIWRGISHLGSHKAGRPTLAGFLRNGSFWHLGCHI